MATCAVCLHEQVVDRQTTARDDRRLWRFFVACRGIATASGLISACYIGWKRTGSLTLCLPLTLATTPSAGALRRRSFTLSLSRRCCRRNTNRRNTNRRSCALRLLAVRSGGRSRVCRRV